MKKLLLTVLLLGCSIGKVLGYEVPGANTSQQASISYGGVKYSSSVFSAAITSVTYSSITAQAYPVPSNIYPQGAFVIYGVEFSTGPCGVDFVDVFDSSSTGNILNIPQPNKSRWYNVNGSSQAGSSAGGYSCSGFSGPTYPVRYTQGAFFQPSSAGYNMIKLYYWKPD